MAYSEKQQKKEFLEHILSTYPHHIDYYILLNAELAMVYLLPTASPEAFAAELKSSLLLRRDFWGIIKIFLIDIQQNISVSVDFSGRFS